MEPRFEQESLLDRHPSASLEGMDLWASYPTILLQICQDSVWLWREEEFLFLLYWMCLA